MALTTQQMIEAMLKYQYELNNKTNGYNWPLGICKNGKTINWELCFDMELAELLNSYNWKHWKDGGYECLDLENVKVEITDLWHFVMSQALSIHIGSLFREELTKVEGFKEEDLQSGDTLKRYLDEVNFDKESFINRVYEEIPVVATALKLDAYIEQQHANLKVNETFEQALQEPNFISMLVDMVTDKFNQDDKSDFRMFSKFYTIMTYVAKVYDFGVEALYKYYMAKMCLNIFRQENGYRDGTYRKVWNGKEDNQYLKEILDDPNMDISNKEAILARLKEIYNETK